MPNPYEWAFTNPELLPWYAAVTLFLVAWVFLSFRFKYRLYQDLKAGRKRWDNSVMPDWKWSKEAFWFLTIVSINLVLVGAYLYWVV